MKDFEFVFSLYGLLLGLSMVELLGGLGRVIERRFAAADTGRDQINIGWLTPLLAIFVMLDLLSFWIAAWTVRSSVTVSGTTLLAVATFASLYYLAARLVFPTSDEGLADLDAHYLRVRRVVLGLLLVLLAAQLIFYWQDPALAQQFRHPAVWGTTLILVALMAGAMLVKSRRGSVILLSLLVARYAVIYIV